MPQLCPETFVLKTAELSYPAIVQHPGTYFISKNKKRLRIRSLSFTKRKIIWKIFSWLFWKQS